MFGGRRTGAPAACEAHAARAHSRLTLCRTMTPLPILDPVLFAADTFEWGGLKFEVMDMDGRRIDKVLVMRKPTPAK